MSWSFADAKRKDTSYATHGYHRYPAKFIPQLCGRLIENYSNIGDRVVDPFAGCGTTLVEAKIRGRESYGVDANPIAVLISQAKLKPHDPLFLEKWVDDTLVKIASIKEPKNIPSHDKIDYWFPSEQKRMLSIIFEVIKSLIEEYRELNENNAVWEPSHHYSLSTFYFCAFSNILKNCSIWLQKSNKPTRDFKKKPSDPLIAFKRQLKSMVKGNNEYYNLLQSNGNLNVWSRPHKGDARRFPSTASFIDLIVTSPPYVTSYEYADLHQLSTLWFANLDCDRIFRRDFANIDNLSEFRKSFIGTASRQVENPNLNSSIANDIITKLESKHKKTAKEVATYFSEMNEVWQEMYRILKPNGYACIVIGNTKFHNVDILNAEVFLEQFLNLGFEFETLIKREIPSKNLPSVRDKKTGRFAKITHDNKTFAYPTEYILVVRKT